MKISYIYIYTKYIVTTLMRKQNYKCLHFVRWTIVHWAVELLHIRTYACTYNSTWALCTIWHVSKFQLFFNNLLGFVLRACRRLHWQATADDTSKVSEILWHQKPHIRVAWRIILRAHIHTYIATYIYMYVGTRDFF